MFKAFTSSPYGHAFRFSPLNDSRDAEIIFESMRSYNLFPKRYADIDAILKLQIHMVMLLSFRRHPELHVRRLSSNPYGIPPCFYSGCVMSDMVLLQTHTVVRLVAEKGPFDFLIPELQILIVMRRARPSYKVETHRGGLLVTQGILALKYEADFKSIRSCDLLRNRGSRRVVTYTFKSIRSWDLLLPALKKQTYQADSRRVSKTTPL
jgi:hypothetical protein